MGCFVARPHLVGGVAQDVHQGRGELEAEEHGDGEGQSHAREDFPQVVQMVEEGFFLVHGLYLHFFAQAEYVFQVKHVRDSVRETRRVSSGKRIMIILFHMYHIMCLYLSQ